MRNELKKRLAVSAILWVMALCIQLPHFVRYRNSSSWHFWMALIELSAMLIVAVAYTSNLRGALKREHAALQR